MPKTRRRAPAQERRASILEAAQAVFQEKDYHEITMDDIARRARVAKGTLYLYFPAKEDLFRALAEEVGRRILEAWKSVQDESSPGEERLKSLIKVQLELFEKNRGVFLQVFQGNMPAVCMGGPKGRSEMVMTPIRTMAKVIDEAMKLKVLRRTDPFPAAVALFGLVRGFIFARILGGMPGRLPDKAEFIWEIFYRGMRP
jgi:AcrR family transcriptional regulator